MHCVTCKCLNEQDLASFLEDPTRLEPSLVSCLGCLPTTNRGVRIQDMPLRAVNPAVGVTYGQILSTEWCNANPNLGFIRGRAGTGHDTLFAVDQTGLPWTVRTTNEGNFFVWQDPKDPAGVSQTIASLPRGIDRTLIGDIMYSIYVVRQVGRRQCVTFPSSPQPWYERRVHADDRYVILGNEQMARDIGPDGSLFGGLKAKLDTPGSTLSVRCVVRLA